MRIVRRVRRRDFERWSLDEDEVIEALLVAGVDSMARELSTIG